MRKIKHPLRPDFVKTIVSTKIGKRVELNYDIEKLEYHFVISEELFTLDKSDLDRIDDLAEQGSKELGLHKRLMSLETLSKNGANVEAHEGDDGAAWVVTWKD